jgi:hypothetical protein
VDIPVPKRCALCGKSVASRADFIRHTFVHEIAGVSGQRLAEADEGLAYLEEIGLARIEGDEMVLPRPTPRRPHD